MLVAFLLVIGAAFYLVAFSTIRLVGDALFEIETDKVVNQIEAEHAGRITKLLAEEGDELEPGAVLAEIEE